jgi:hypothetical protein
VQSGHPGHTTPEQDAQVFQLRSILEGLGYTERLDTLTLLRFLRARKFNVENARAMYVPFSSSLTGVVAWCCVLGGLMGEWMVNVLCRFVACEEWRQKFGADELAKTFEYTERAEVFEYYPQYYHKTDKVTSPHFLLPQDPTSNEN